MPASFKVRTVPLDGRNDEFEDVLDPDFGESAIGRVAPVDSGKRIILRNILLLSCLFLIFVALLHSFVNVNNLNPLSNDTHGSHHEYTAADKAW